MSEQDDMSERRREWLNLTLRLCSLSERDLGLRTRYAVGEIRSWQSGSKPISAPVMLELAAAIGVDAPEDLLKS